MLLSTSYDRVLFIQNDGHIDMFLFTFSVNGKNIRPYSNGAAFRCAEVYSESSIVRLKWIVSSYESKSVIIACVNIY